MAANTLSPISFQAVESSRHVKVLNKRAGDKDQVWLAELRGRDRFGFVLEPASCFKAWAGFAFYIIIATFPSQTVNHP